MTSCGIGDAEMLLGVKAHVIRYWEKEIPLIRSRRDHGGRRVYAKRDLLMLFRLKHLLYDRRFTIQGAREQLYREYAGENVSQDLKASLEALRSELVDMYFLVRNHL